MRFTFSSVVLVARGQWGGVVPEAERRRILEWAARTGFAGIEISPRWLNVLDDSDTQLEALRREVAAAGLVVSGLNLNRCILTRTEHAPAHLRQIRAAIHAAAMLHAPVVNVSLSMPDFPSPERPVLRGSDVPPAEHERSAALVRQLGVEAGEAGVTLSVELHDDGLLDTPERLLELLRRVDLPHVGANPDIGNLVRSEGAQADWRAAVRLLARHTVNLHVKNYRAGQPSPIWEGDIDFREAFALLRGGGYDGWVGIEAYSPDALELQEKALRWLQQITLSISTNPPANTCV